MGADLIARFLNWKEFRVGYSLERLHLIDEKIVDKEAVESLPTERAARDFVMDKVNKIMLSKYTFQKIKNNLK